jgi:hypothetical protein
MLLNKFSAQCTLLFALGIAVAPFSYAASCTTQAQMTTEQRNEFAQITRDFAGIVARNDMQALQAKMLPAVAADFAGIAASAQAISPSMQHATITVDAIYELDASKDQASTERTQFFCGSPTVVLTFDGLPQGVYALSIIHATGVPKPQQIALILAKGTGDTWLLAGFYGKPMIEDGHDGLWYWTSARKYAEAQKKWDAWVYYRLAASLLDPLDFLSSPNLQKLQHETEQTRPPDVPGSAPMILTRDGKTYTVTAVDTTTEFGALDIDLHYTPDPSEAEQLRAPMTARQQVTNVMTALMEQHPELREAFHGIWVHADQGNASLYALELPMSGIGPTQPVQQPSAH